MMGRWLYRNAPRYYLMVMAAAMLLGAVVARRSVPLGVAMATAASGFIVLFFLSQRRNEALVRATNAVNLATLEKLARTSPKQASAWMVVDSAKAVGRFRALRALVIVGGTRRFHARPDPFAICSTDHEAIGENEQCPVCVLDKELGLVVDAVGLMERGEYRAASRLLVPKGERATPETLQEQVARPFRFVLGGLAFTLAGRELRDLKSVAKAFPTLRWAAQMTMALVAHRKGEDVSALLREIPAHPEGTFIEAVRASILEKAE